MQFSSMVVAKLGAYVYALVDPRSDASLRDRVFYIGKGNGNRFFNHANIERERGEAPLHEAEHKLGRIREIRQAGKEVEVLIVDHGLDDEAALRMEAVLIPLFGDTNKVSGHGDRRLWLTENQIIEAYDIPVMRETVPLFQGNLLLVSLNQQDIESLQQPHNEERLAEATLGNWNLSVARSAHVDCIVGVKNGLIFSIFETAKRSDGTTEFLRIENEKKHAHGRSRFNGHRRQDLERNLRGRSLKDGTLTLSKIRPGAGCQYIPAKD